jgi:predicted alpha/beta-hydrolase family hydrolase
VADRDPPTEQRLIDTVRGPARLHIDRSDEPHGLLILGHGAGGSVTAPDLAALAAAAPRAGISVVRVEQPYRVAGRRSPAPAAQLDEVWVAAVAAARARIGTALPLVVGGRSSGARVAARTIHATAASGLLAFAFPLVSPRGVSRQHELDAVDVPVLILQGDRDRFGLPGQTPQRRVHVLTGADHALRGVAAELSAVALAWLSELLADAHHWRRLRSRDDRNRLQ